MCIGCGADNFVGHDKAGKRVFAFPTEQIQQPVVCDGWAPGGGCNHWGPSTPPDMELLHPTSGTQMWFPCAGDNNAYFTETVITSATNYQGYCFYSGTPDGRAAYAHTLGDMDYPFTPQGPFQIRSWKINGVRNIWVYDGPNATGTKFGPTSCWTGACGFTEWSGVPGGAWEISSLFIRQY
jgi:hypothetical protein